MARLDRDAHELQVLNALIAATMDSADAYGEAARETENPQLRGLFEQRGFERRQVAAGLRLAVRRLGGRPQPDGSLLGKARRAWMDVRHALLRQDRVTVHEVEAAEDAVKDRFERALADTRLSPAAREVIERNYAPVRRTHDEMRALKHRMKAAGTDAVPPLPRAGPA
ncbi:PA2169 family four-helix-bundle protein [Brevundimonas balnearis]|uniref:PA2169 family four-helix-bundle protein n=1 Tax=Brevundimonas balnearis TaxID=1572858 RepID=A0ABV6R3Q2_9CAUL